METRAHYIIVGAFVLTVLVGVLASVVWLARIQFEREGARYDVFFRGSVGGLVDGAAVRYHGVAIGRVLSIRLDPENIERVRVRIEIDSATPIKEDAVASLEVQGITGQAYVQLSGGSNASSNLKTPPDRAYPVIRSRPSQLEEVVSSAPELFKRATQVADRLNEMLGEDNQAALTHTLKNLDLLTGSLAKDAQQISRIVDQGADAAAELRNTAITANKLLAHLDETLLSRGGLADRAGATLDDFGRSARTLAEMSQHLDALVQENRPSLKEFTQRGLSQLQQAISDARTLIGELNRIADSLERDPQRFIYGDRREGYRPR